MFPDIITEQKIRDLAEQARAPHPAHLAAIPTAGPGEPYYLFLNLLARALGATRAVDLGTYKGTSARYIADAMPKGWVYTYDIDPAAREWLQQPPVYQNVTFRLEDALAPRPKPFVAHVLDLLFIDLDPHDYAITMGAYRNWEPLVQPGGVIALDDTQLNEDMRQVVREVEQETQVIPLHHLHHSGFSVIVKESRR